MTTVFRFYRFIWLLGVWLCVAACGPVTVVTPTPTIAPPMITSTLPAPTLLPPTSLPATPATAVPVDTYRILNTYPHDPNAFTQGLVWDEGVMYEGTGLYGRSSLRRVDLTTGQVLQSVNLTEEYFGEGIIVVNDRIIQLTWQNQVGFVYDKTTLALLQQFSYPTEGWGITRDDQRLIMSDGTDTLYFWHPDTLAEIGRVQVTSPEGPVNRLNELEYIKGEVWANIWQTNLIARINPDTGQVLGWIDLTGLLAGIPSPQPVDVLNGIMYDAANDRLFVTGKLWPTLFEIEVVRP